MFLRHVAVLELELSIYPLVGGLATIDPVR
jgi:hypothetical protein